MKIKKKDLIDLTYQKANGINKNVVSSIINSFLEELYLILSKNEEVNIELRGFGVFKKKKRKEVIIQNPKTKQKSKYSDLYSIKFRISKESKIKKEVGSDE